MREFVRFLDGRSRLFYICFFLLAVANGLWSTALLAMINKAIRDTAFFGQYDWVIFTCLFFVSFLATRYFQSYMIEATQNISYELVLKILDKLRKCTYEDFEKLGNEKVLTVIEDTRSISGAPYWMIEAFSSLVILVVGICCLVWFYLFGAILVVSLVVLLSAFYIYKNGRIGVKMQRWRDSVDVFTKNLNDLLRGFKIFRMSSTRMDNFYSDYLHANRALMRNITKETSKEYLHNELLGNYSFYLVIGFVVFVLPVFFEVDHTSISMFIVTLFYLMGPISNLIGAGRTLTALNIALSRVRIFSDALDQRVDASELPRSTSEQELDSHIESIEIEDLSYQYYDRRTGEKTFLVGPLNLEIRRGEIIFVTGKNGSGKSTFVNLITGLYYPSLGNIRVNSKRVQKASYEAYRDMLACVFSDCYLLDRNYDSITFNQVREELSSLIALMQLDKAICTDYDKNFISHELSKGQQKRLALIYAMLERKDILVMDEFTAEQDPSFREYFYVYVLPELRRRNKTVILVTHDEHYFKYADSIIEFEDGRVKELNINISGFYEKS